MLLVCPDQCPMASQLFLKRQIEVVLIDRCHRPPDDFSTIANEVDEDEREREEKNKNGKK
jgi:hypothetical protein